jgi:hypothetical protein
MNTMNALSTFAGDILPTTLSQSVTRQSSEDTVKGISRSWLLAAAAILALALFASGSALAQTDPFVGTWKLNLAKSKFGPGTERKSETRIVESSPTGMKVSVDRTNADGSRQQYNYTL